MGWRKIKLPFSMFATGIFKEKTDCSVIVNTSFNVRGEPIVCDVKDAYKCFMGTNLDILVCNNFIMYKNQQVSAA